MSTQGHGLGFDAGGTQTRWALADADGRIVAEGAAAGFSGLQLASDDGRAAIRAVFAAIAAQLPSVRPASVYGGMTGYGGESAVLRDMAQAAFGIGPKACAFSDDLEIAYRGMFMPGEGYLIYAGTGSIGAYVDAAGELHRAGGRGVLLDDGGGGAWITLQALRAIWRREDEMPGSWAESPLARALFERIGGEDWAFSRKFIYGGERGSLGLLAVEVARTAASDPLAREVLQAAGNELARLALALKNRFGARPVALSGRAAQLHPLVAEAFRAALPVDTTISVRTSMAHHAAARMALDLLAAAAPVKN